MNPDGDIAFYDWEEVRAEIAEMIGNEAIEEARGDLGDE